MSLLHNEVTRPKMNARCHCGTDLTADRFNTAVFYSF